MSKMDQVFYVVKPEDNVATALEDINIGKAFLRGGLSGEIDALEKIPFGHKIAIMDIPQDAKIIKYGHEVGIATKPIKKGEYVHIHNVSSINDVRSNTFVANDSGVAESVDREYELIN